MLGRPQCGYGYGHIMYKLIAPDRFELMRILVPSALGTPSGSAQKGGYDEPCRIRYLVSPAATPIWTISS